MPTDNKYGRVTLQYGTIPDDEPVIVFRARDALTCPLISTYHKMCVEAGSPQLHLGLIEQTYKTFADWQQANPEKMTVPNSEAHRDRLEG